MVRWWEFKPTRGFTWSWKELINHSGIDLGAPCGTVITAPVDGTVVHSGVQPWGGQIDLATDKVPGYGPIIISFLHTSQQFIEPGEQVKAGENLGTSGQPPPGGRYGAGCHIHFETTHGVVAPYDSGQYSPSQNPNAKSYPMDPGPLLSWLLDGHAPPDQVGGDKSRFGGSGGQGSADDPCGPEPDSSTYPGGVLNPAFILADQQWKACEIANYGTVPGSPVQKVTGVWDAISPWLGNPIRIIKMVVGFGLVMLGLLLAFLPDFGAAAVSAVGAPSLAPAASAAGSGHPKRAVGSLIRAGGQRIGRQRAATKEAVVQRRAVAQARTLEQTRMYREETTRRLNLQRAQQKAAQRAQQQTQRTRQTTPNTGGAGGRRAGTFHFGPAFRPSTAQSRREDRVKYKQQAKNAKTEAKQDKQGAAQKPAGGGNVAGAVPGRPTDEEIRQRVAQHGGVDEQIRQASKGFNPGKTKKSKAERQADASSRHAGAHEMGFGQAPTMQQHATAVRRNRRSVLRRIFRKAGI